MRPRLDVYSAWKLVLMASFLPLFTVTAANHCIRAGATGANDGSDWVNAYTSVPSTLVRGDIYYIASGNYSHYMFSTPESGTTLSTLRKATVADHGTDTGWSASYASGQAVFPGFEFSTGYLMVDGATRWGIKVTCGSPGTGIDSRRVGGASVSSITFQYVESAGPASSAPYPYQVGGDCQTVYCCFFQGPTLNDLQFKNCYFHGSSTVFQSAGTVRMLIENCILADSRIDYGASGFDPNKPHDNIAFIQQGTDTTFRFNTVSNWDVTGFYPNGTSPGTHRIYGNYFNSSVSSGAAIWFYATITAGNGTWLIYNNTFKDIANGAIYTDSGASPIGSVTNNIFYNYNFCWWGSLTHDYNWYSGSSTYNEPNGIAGGSTNPFSTAPNIVSTIGASFPRNKGHPLDAQYATDVDGNTRGADGAWDMGAIEYSTGVPSTNPVISVSTSGLDFGSIAVGSSNQLTFTVQNTGAGTLSGSCSVASPFSVVSGGTYNLASNQSQVVTVLFSPAVVGNFNQTLTLSGGGGTSVAVSGSSWTPLAGLSFDSTAGVITAPFVIDPSNYISQTVETGVTNGGRAAYAFTLTNAGSYSIQMQVDAPDASANSLYVNVDAEPTDPDMIWDIMPFTTGLQNRVVSWRGNSTFDNPQFVNKPFDLSAGVHQLIIRGREANVKVGRITIMKAVPPPSNLRATSPP
jgi:HYDIN/CFA65/VesB-like, Ig-like domain